ALSFYFRVWFTLSVEAEVLPPQPIRLWAENAAGGSNAANPKMPHRSPPARATAARLAPLRTVRCSQAFSLMQGVPVPRAICACAGARCGDAGYTARGCGVT